MNRARDPAVRNPDAEPKVARPRALVAPIRFQLPLPPSTNALYATVRTGGGSGTGTRRVSSPAARSFRRAVLPTLDSIEGSGAHEATLQLAREAYWSIALAVFFASPRRRDLDDVLKIAIDVICEGLRISDNRLVDLHASKYLAPLEPRIDVEIEGFSDWSFGDERAVLRPDADGR
ncbi:MAG: RusA family crossover junction endodeoxyribonuclease [Chloroflexota bacterium]